MIFVSRLKSACFVLGIPAVLCAAASAQDNAGKPAQDPAQQQIQLETKVPERPKIEPVFAHQANEPVQEVPFDERLQRAELYLYGNNVTNLVILESLLDAEAARRAAAQQRVGGEQITEEMVSAKVKEQLDLFLSQAPNGDFWRMRLVEGYTPEHYHRTVRLVLRVVEMFFPQDPEQWPLEQLREIYRADQPNSNWPPIEREYSERMQMKSAGKQLPAFPQDFILSYVMLPGVLAWLRAGADIKTPVDGLPVGVALRVNGRDFATSDLLKQAGPLITPMAEEQASQLVGLLEAVEKDLRAQKKWLSRATLDQLWAAERAGYEGTIFTHEQTVLEFLGFPSMDVYRQYFNARQSFRTTLPATLPKEMIDQEIAERGAFLGLGKVDADVILLAAVDRSALEYQLNPRVYKPGADPFAAAEKLAREASQQLQDGEPFDSVLTEYSEYPAKAQGDGSNVLQRDRGRFSLLTRADLRVLLAESDFTDFLQGYSIGDDLFFKAEKDAVYGPTRGPLGWYLYRITRRDPPSETIDPVANPRHAYQVEEDLTTQRFLAYVNRLR